MSPVRDPSSLLKDISQGFRPIFFDCRWDFHFPDNGAKGYAWSHIPGAYYMDLFTDMVAPYGPGDHPFRPNDDFVHQLEYLGISTHTPVVCYDDGNWCAPARLAYHLKECGLKNVMVLDGGLPAWIQAGGKADQTPPSLPGGQGKISFPGPNRRIDYHDFQKAIKDPATLVLDSRGKDRYLGQEDPISPKTGHIPGSYHLYYRSVLGANNRFKSTQDLELLFRPLRFFKRLILSCGSGISACVLSLGLDLLNIPHELYAGSFSDWISHPNTQAEKPGRFFPTDLPSLPGSRS